MWAEDHQGEFPAALNDLVTTNVIPAELLNINSRPGTQWIYLRPPPLSRKPRAGDIIVFHEPADPWPGEVIAGFLDGHTENIKDRRVLEDLMARSQAATKAATP
jgi:hypothetical protein